MAASARRRSAESDVRRSVSKLAASGPGRTAFRRDLSAGCRVVVWALALAAAGTAVEAQAQAQLVNSSQALITAVTRFAASSTLNSTTTLLLAPVINMTSSVGAYPNANSSSFISPGVLVLNSALGAGAKANLDAGMQSGLTAPWDNTTSTLRWQVSARRSSKHLRGRDAGEGGPGESCVCAAPGMRIRCPPARRRYFQL